MARHPEPPPDPPWLRAALWVLLAATAAAGAWGLWDRIQAWRDLLA